MFLDKIIAVILVVMLKVFIEPVPSELNFFFLFYAIAVQIIGCLIMARIIITKYFSV